MNFQKRCPLKVLFVKIVSITFLAPFSAPEALGGSADLPYLGDLFRDTSLWASQPPKRRGVFDWDEDSDGEEEASEPIGQTQAQASVDCGHVVRGKHRAGEARPFFQRPVYRRVVNAPRSIEISFNAAVMNSLNGKGFQRRRMVANTRNFAESVIGQIEALLLDEVSMSGVVEGVSDKPSSEQQPQKAFKKLVSISLGPYEPTHLLLMLKLEEKKLTVLAIERKLIHQERAVYFTAIAKGRGITTESVPSKLFQTRVSVPSDLYLKAEILRGLKKEQVIRALESLPEAWQLGNGHVDSWSLSKTGQIDPSRWLYGISKEGLGPYHERIVLIFRDDGSVTNPSLTLVKVDFARPDFIAESEGLEPIFKRD